MSSEVSRVEIDWDKLESLPRDYITGMFWPQKNSYDWSSLENMIDEYPRHKILAFTMGDDPQRYNELHPIDTRGVSGKDALKAISQGRIWFKLLGVHEIYEEIKVELGYLFNTISNNIENFLPLEYSATLIISSPGTQVYYHSDPRANFLWHIRGPKTIWIYPNDNPELLAPTTLEKIVVNYQDEEMYYEKSFERFAKKFDLQEGQFLAWPHYGPHRVEVGNNMSVSLATLYLTEDAHRENSVISMNYWLRNWFHLGDQNLSANRRGLDASAKQLLFRVLSRVGLVKGYPNREYMAQYRLDPSSPTGISRIPGEAVRTEFMNFG